MHNESIEEDTYKCIQVSDLNDDLPSEGAHFPGHYSLDHWIPTGGPVGSPSERPI